MRISEIVREHNRLAGALTGEDSMSLIQRCVDALYETFNNGGTLYLCGNGGSAADAQHIAAELAGKFYRVRDSLPAIALTTNTSTLTAVANDYGYEYVFFRQLAGVFRKHDAVLGLSTSGKSLNVKGALEYAIKSRVTTIAFTGANGMYGLDVPLCLKVPSVDTPRIQEIHILAGHIICEMVEERIFGNG